MANPADLPDVLPEDRLLWQFWVNKGMRPEALRARLDDLPEAVNWDYIAGNAMYGGFEEDLLAAIVDAPRPGLAGRIPGAFPASLRRDVAGSRHPVTPGTPEGRLLVLCASPRMTVREDEEAAAAAAGSIVWEAFVQAAARANLTVAVHHNMIRLDLGRHMPRDLAGVLAARARGVAARNRRMLVLLDQITSWLRDAGIGVLLLKESALALSHYGNGRLRMMGDIDLLLPEAEVERVVDMLEQRGFESAEVLWTKDHYRRRHHHAAPLVNEGLAAKIEPHRTIALPVVEPPGMVAAMAGRSVQLDARARCFTPADILFHLCVDLFGNAFLGKMGQAIDAREVVRQGGVEWPLLEEVAVECGAQAHVAFSLSLIAGLDAPVPAEVIRRLEAGRRPDFDARGLRRMADRNLFGYVKSRAWLSRAGEKLVYASRLRPGGWIARSAFILRSYLYVGVPTEGVGDLGRQARPTTMHALGRLAGTPLRALRRWTASRRMP